MHQLVKTVILGVIQGLTEWLPISSTAHLKLFENLLGFEVARELILFDVILHIGTLIVIIVFFREEVVKILSAVACLDFKSQPGRMVPLIIVGVLPTFLIGGVAGELIEETFQNILPIGVSFLFYGTVLYSLKFDKEETDTINYPTAIMIGVAQGIAIVPGISRSGITIAAALLLGVKRERAFQFSFLISIPAVLGALGYTVCTEFGELTSAGLGWSEILVGATVSMVVGYFALKLLWKTVAQRKLYLFAIYCWLLGALLILLKFTAI